MTITVLSGIAFGQKTLRVKDRSGGRRYMSVRMRHPKLVAREAYAIDGMMDIDIMKMPPTLLNALRNAGITTIEQLQYVSEDELYRIMRENGLGCVAVDKVKEYLHFSGTRGATIYDPNESG